MNAIPRRILVAGGSGNGCEICAGGVVGGDREDVGRVGKLSPRFISATALPSLPEKFPDTSLGYIPRDQE